MKKIVKFIIGIFLISTPLNADIADGSIGSETIPYLEPEADGRAFKLEVSGDAIGKANFNHSKDGNLRFNVSEAEFRFVFFFNPDYEEGAYCTLGYELARIKWNKNPYFHKSEFRTASLSLGAFTHRLPDWRWVSEATVNLDTDHPNFSQYAFYEYLLWGRYTYCSTIGVHVGLFFDTGMKIDHVYPVIGFDWQISKKWKLNLVFPLDISLAYTFAECWQVSLAGRLFTERFRVGANEPLPKGLVTYRNAGVEVALDYDCERLIAANLHIGYSAGGVLKIANRHYSHKHRYDFEGAGYVGGEFALRF